MAESNLALLYTLEAEFSTNAYSPRRWGVTVITRAMGIALRFSSLSCI